MDPASVPSLNDGSRGRRARTPSLLISVAYAACIVLPVALVIAIDLLKPDAFSSPIAPAEPPRAATAAEQRAILIAVIEHQQSSERSPTFDANGVQHRLALENLTVSICGKPRQSEERCRQLSPQWYEDPHYSRNHSYSLIDRDLSEKLVDALRRFNSRQRPLDIRSVPGIVAVDHERITAMYEAIGYRREFHQVYPHAGGILRVSWPVVTARGDQAVLYVVSTYQPSTITSQMELFALRQGQWKFVGVVGDTQMEIS